MANKAEKAEKAEIANTQKRKKIDIVEIVFAAVLIVLILPILLLTLVLVIKAAVNPDYPPDIFGYAPLTVASGSMTGDNEDSFDEGDLIFVKVLDDDEKNAIEEQDVICYITDGVYVTHRVVSVTYEDGVLISVITRGDANASDDSAVLAADIYGIYSGKIANLGSFAEFLQTPAGIVVFVGVPIAAFVLFEASRLILVNRKKSEESEIKSKDEEIERLKKMLGEKTADEESADGGEKPDGAKNLEEDKKAAAEETSNVEKNVDVESNPSDLKESDEEKKAD